MSLSDSLKALGRRLVREFVAEMHNSQVPKEVLASAKIVDTDEGSQVVVDHPEAGTREYGSQTVPMTPFFRPAVIRSRRGQDTKVAQVVEGGVKEALKSFETALRP